MPRHAGLPRHRSVFTFVVALFLGAALALSGCSKRTGDGVSAASGGGGGGGGGGQTECTSAPTVEASDDMVSFVVGQPITPITIDDLDDDCPSDDFTVDPALPDGLTLSPDGVIDGTPTMITPVAIYTVTATNDNGSTDIDISIAVGPPAPISVTYPDAGIALVIDEPMTPITPTVVGGPVDSYTVDVPFPAGLTLDPNTGEISGTPTEVGMTSHEITASNATGSVSTTFIFAIFPPLQPAGFARYFDANRDGEAGPGDFVTVGFNQDVELNGAVADDIPLPVDGDTFGTGAMVVSGPQPHEITIVLGTDPNLKTRQRFDGTTTPNSPSGVDVDLTVPGTLISDFTGSDPLPGMPVDLLAGYVETPQDLGMDCQDAAFADIDGDGIPDLVIAADGANTVFFGLPDGTFADAGVALGSAVTTDVTVADIDGDGDLDLICANADPSGVQVFSGDGSGGFTLTTDLTLAGVTDLTVGDLDGDGDLDVIANDSILTNDGSGQLTVAGPFGAGAGALSLALGDVDRDGDLDCYHAADGLAGAIFFNDGDGNFTMGTQAFDPNATGAEFADFDRDGILDLVLVFAENAQVWTGDGTGGFTLAQDFGDLAREDVLVIDADQDGILDLFLGDAGLVSQTQLWIGEGDGTFAPSETWVAGSIAGAQDVDGDGDLDVVTVGIEPDGAARISASSLAGTWGTASLTDTSTLVGDGFVFEFARGDVDRDGDLDLIAANTDLATSGLGNVVFLNDGDGNFTEGALIGNSNTEDVVLLDVDKDGDLDLFCGNREAPNELYLNDGNGNFTDSGLVLPLDNTACLATGDFDRDGNPDIAVGNRGDNMILFGDGTTLQPSTQTLFTGWTYDLVAADIDGDGDLDLIEGTSLGRHNKIWFNDGTGNFTPGAGSIGSFEVRDIAVGDLDEDGDLDLVLGHDSAGPGWPNVVLFNDGNGNFSENQQFPDADRTVGLGLADLDADGDLDLLVANVGQDVWYQNDGTGLFGPANLIGAPDTESYAVQIADFDRDGDLDAMIGRRTDGSALIKNE